MKALFRQKLLNSLFIVLFPAFSLNTYAGWVDDWVSQSTHSGPDYFEGQKRGYFNGGSYSARFRNSNEYPFSIQKPRLKSGCGGIDLFLGGVSFMDAEYLMQKLQAAIQAASVVAFDLALKTMAPEIASTVKEFEAIINELNGLQMSECGMANKVVEYSGIASMFDSEQSAKASASKNYTESKEQQRSNNGKPTQEQSKSIEGCSAEFKAIFTQNGSILTHIATSKGLEQYAPYMRAYLGDVIINYQDKQYSHQVINPCNKMQVDKMDEILVGDAWIRPNDGSACVKGSDKGLLQVVDDLMHSIALKIKNKNGNYTTQETKFLQSMPAPVFKALNYASKVNNIDFQINVLREPTAKAMSYAIVHDLVNKIYELIRLANMNVKQANNGVSDKSCEPTILQPIVDTVKDLKIEATRLSLAIKKAQAEQIRNYVDNINFNKSLQNQGSNTESNANKSNVK